MEEVKTKSHLFHFLSGARWGNWAKERYENFENFENLDRFSAENDYGTVQIFELL